MNRFVAVLFLVASVSAQGPPPQQNGCGCAPAPVVIQLSCGNNGQQMAPPPPPPEHDGGPPPCAGLGPQPPPFGESAEAAFDQLFGPGTGTDDMESLMNMCEFDTQGYPTSHPAGGFPEGFRIGTDADGHPAPHAPAGFPGPNPHWDGTPQTLGFTMPARGTAHFNMLMCWPLAVPVMG